MTRQELQKDMEARTAQASAMLGDPAKAEEFKSLTEKVNVIGEQLRAMDKADAEVRAMREAETKLPSPVLTEKSGWNGIRNQILEAINNRGGRIDISGVERRGIVSNGSGVGTAPGIVRALVDGGRLRSKVSTYLGKNAVTVVPVFSPSMAVPVGSVPGATGTASDSTAVLTGDQMTLKAWYSTLAISMGALMSSDIERELPAIFSENFGAAIDKGILVGAGSGSDMLGAFVASSVGVPTGSDITATGSGAAPVWADYVKMALTLLGLSGDQNSLAIVVNPAVFATALGVATGSDPNKVEYMTKGTILGIPVILSGYALTTLSSGSYVAVGGYWKHYGLAIAQEIMIDQIKTVGSDDITFQAFMYMQGKPLVGSSFRRLKTG
jgi:HK97 family phage major capsid protein